MTEPARILVTGARGFTGIHFVRAAEASGYVVVPLEANLLDSEAVRREVLSKEFSHVVHLAAISYVGHEDLRAFYDVNLFGTLHLLEGLLSRGTPPFKVILASSANVYGNTLHSPVPETEGPAPVNHYAMSKFAMERMALNYADRLPIVITRPFNYTGPFQADSFLIPKIVRHFRGRLPEIRLGNTHIEREFNDVRMLCDSYLKLMTKGSSGETYNICTGQGYSIQHILETLSDLTGHQLQVIQDSNLMRANEIHRLCGNPQKLLETLGGLKEFALADTLAWMVSPEAFSDLGPS